MNSNAMPPEIETIAHELSQSKVAVITTMNTVCGIAEYSRELYSPIKSIFREFHYIANRDVADRTRPDEKDVVRLWEYGETSFADVLAWLNLNQPDILHIQLHSEAHFTMVGLVNLLQGIKALKFKIQIVITPHSVRNRSFDLGAIVSELKPLCKILVHKQQDYDYLTSIGLHYVEIFQHPFDSYPTREKNVIRKRLGITASPIVVTHGLISEHKGLVEMAQAIHLLKSQYPNILWLAVNAVNLNNTTSSATYSRMQAAVSATGIENNVRFFPDFLSPQEVTLLIQASDVGVCAYNEVGESASGAVRKFMASGTALIVTDIPMMQEVDEVLKIKHNDPATIADAIDYLIKNPQVSSDLAKAALNKCSMHSWKVMSQELLKVYEAL